MILIYGLPILNEKMISNTHTLKIRGRKSQLNKIMEVMLAYNVEIAKIVDDKFDPKIVWIFFEENQVCSELEFMASRHNIILDIYHVDSDVEDNRNKLYNILARMSELSMFEEIHNLKQIEHLSDITNNINFIILKLKLEIVELKQFILKPLQTEIKEIEDTISDKEESIRYLLSQRIDKHMIL